MQTNTCLQTKQSAHKRTHTCCILCEIEFVHGGPKPNGSQQKKKEGKKLLFHQIENSKTVHINQEFEYIE